MYGTRKQLAVFPRFFSTLFLCLFTLLFTLQAFSETATPAASATSSTSTSSTAPATTTQTSPPASTAQSSTPSLPQNNSGGGETTITIPPPPPPVTPSQPPPPSDRQGDNKAASAAAIAGAAIAGASCAMMMAQAMQMPPGPERNQMMMMAMMQCAQAAQSAAAAAQNKKQAKQLSQADVPKQAELQPAQQIKIPNGNNGSGIMPELSKVDENPIAAPATIAAPEELELPESAGATEAGPEGTVDQFTATSEGPSFTKLTPIETASNFYKDGNEKRVPTPNPQTPPPGNPSGNIGNTNLTPDALKRMAGLGTDGDPRANGRGGIGNNGDGGGGEIETLGSASGSESSGSGGSDNSAFDAMLAQLMGPSAEGGPGGFDSGAGQDFAVMPTNASGEQKVNIFQYASFRYQYSAYNENKIKLRQPLPPPQATAPGHESTTFAGFR